MEQPYPAIIIRGNPVDGFEYVGPFASNEAACAYGNTDPLPEDGDWWVADLHAPAEGVGATPKTDAVIAAGKIRKDGDQYFFVQD